ncbi:hypothetical protein BGX28_002683, partial [Mortierella sp. GBA30]
MSAPTAALLEAIANLPADQRNAIIAAAASMATPAPNPGASQREIDAENRDVARTIHKIIKPTPPVTYHGEVDADACLNFIDNQEEYYKVVNLHQADW